MNNRVITLKFYCTLHIRTQNLIPPSTPQATELKKSKNVFDVI